MFELTLNVGTIVLSGPYAYRFQRGLFVPHGRSSVEVFISDTLHAATCPQFTMLVACPRSKLDPSAMVRVPLGAPSTNADRTVPCRMLFQSGTVSRSSITRSTPASAAYSASWPNRKLPVIVDSVVVDNTRAMPSADSSSI